MEQSHTHLIPNRSSKNPTHSMILFVERRVCNGLSKIILILPSLTVKSASNVPSLCFGFSFASTQSQASVPQKQNMHLFCCWWSAFSPHFSTTSNGWHSTTGFRLSSVSTALNCTNCHLLLTIRLCLQSVCILSVFCALALHFLQRSSKWQAFPVPMMKWTLK